MFGGFFLMMRGGDRRGLPAPSTESISAEIWDERHRGGVGGIFDWERLGKSGAGWMAEAEVFAGHMALEKTVVGLICVL